MVLEMRPAPPRPRVPADAPPVEWSRLVVPRLPPSRHARMAGKGQGGGVRRYLAKTRKRSGGFVCLRCEGRFAGRDAYDRHIVNYPGGDWCHLSGEVGLVVGMGGWARL